MGSERKVDVRAAAAEQWNKSEFHVRKDAEYESAQRRITQALRQSRAQNMEKGELMIG